MLLLLYKWELFYIKLEIVLPELCLAYPGYVQDQRGNLLTEQLMPSKDRAKQQEILLDPSYNAKHLKTNE